MSPALAIALKDLRQRFRDRSAIVLGFVAPLVIAVVMSAAFRGTEHFHTDVAVVNHDRGPVSAAFVAMLSSPGVSEVVHLKTVGGEAQARAQVKDGKLGAAFVVPAGFSDAAHSDAPTHITVLGSVNASIAREVCSSLAESFTAQLQADRLSIAAALASGADPTRLAELAAESARLRLPLTVTSGDLGGRQLTATSYYAPSMAIFFAFFGIGFGARSFWTERRSGT
jgi:ABC-2 type transport system permease protein